MFLLKEKKYEIKKEIEKKKNVKSNFHTFKSANMVT